LPGVRSRIVQTRRLAQHVYESGPAGGEAVVLVHGNASSARFFEELLAALGATGTSYIVAADLRGYGATELQRVDAARGLRDYSDDVHALVETLGIDRFHLLGWSLGGCVAMQYVIDHPERVRTLTLHATGSPYGYGGTRDAAGTPTYDDCAGSGGGLIAPQVVERYQAKDFSADSPFAPRAGLRNVIVKPTFQFAPEREDALVEQMLLMAIGDEYYPGDKGPPSPNWPFITPGLYGSNNAVSPKNCNLSALAELHGGPPILWVRGADDVVVSDAAALDPAYLGKIGMIPGWPGEDVCPPQPMLAQIRAVLDGYAANGGRSQELVLDDCGHAPLIEKPEEFLAAFRAFMGAVPSAASSSAAGGHPESAAPAAVSAIAAPLDVAPPTAEPEPLAAGDASEGTRRRRGLFGFLFRRG
jgi:pimeloyl-ACP methyl ester carboxylesterase